MTPKLLWPVRMRKLALPLVASGICLLGCFGQSKLTGRTERGFDPPTDLQGPPDPCAGPIDPGRVTLHRLNRAEYNNTVRDLLGIAQRPADDFPVDDSGYGFDNIADVLSTSPLLVEKYEAAAEALVDAAWDADLSGRPNVAFLICDPNAQSDCPRRILSRFSRRAWRRPATSGEVDRLLSFVGVATGEGDSPEMGLKLALRAVLLSPSFLYRVELDGDPRSSTPHPLNDYELATRLSYFLWSSTPDDELLARAEDGTLHDIPVLDAQVRRMLQDQRASALVENFVGQWLYTRGVDALQPSPILFPQFDGALQTAMRRETELFYKSLVDEGRDALDLIAADYTYVNDRLATHYGLSGVTGSEMRRVSVAGTQRGGILTHASFLAVTSNPNRTSPVKRGKWVLSQLLCSEPPPPPPNVPPFPEGQGQGTLRERMEAHRANPTCASCHAVMDPIGFGLENFDAIGHWRERDTDGTAIDASGQLPENRQFNGARELAALLRQDPRVPSCLVRQIATYALGRGMTALDRCALGRITDSFKSSGNRLPDLFTSVAKSDLFTRRHGEPEAAP